MDAQPLRHAAPTRVSENSREERVHSQCSATNRFGDPCRSPVVLEDGRCPAHSGADMAELGRVGAKRSGEVRRRQGLSIRGRIAERLEREADTAYVRVWTAMQARNVPAALEAVRAAMGVSEDEAAHIEEEAQMLERRRRSLQDGSRWQDDDDAFEEL